jgi:hypothetical protein
LQTHVLIRQNDLGEYLYGEPEQRFEVDSELQHDLQLNVDMTIAMPCRCKFVLQLKLTPDLSIDLRDAVGDRLHLSDEFVKDGVRYEALLCGADFRQTSTSARPNPSSSLTPHQPHNPLARLSRTHVAKPLINESHHSQGSATYSAAHKTSRIGKGRSMLLLLIGLHTTRSLMALRAVSTVAWTSRK